MIKLIKKVFFKKKDLIIYDDVFPSPLSAFRFQEFNYYLEHIQDSLIYTSGYSIGLIDKEKSIKAVINEYKRSNSAIVAKVKPVTRRTHFKSKLVYSLFLKNTFDILPYINYYESPFVFTLYPGGGFMLNDPESDNKLRLIFSSKNFQKVIVTQKTTYNYLIKKGFCDPKKIFFIFGVVATLPIKHIEKKKFPMAKPSIDIVFCANKYTAKGLDKGYDIFVEVAKELILSYPYLKFHVIGGFSRYDIEVNDLPIKFYGSLENENLNQILSNMDIIISPNRHNVLAKGAFDGFPLGACVQAGLNGVLIVATDVYNEGQDFFLKHELLVIEPTKESIIKKIVTLLEDPELLYKYAEAGTRKLNELYSEEVQLKQRLNILKSIIEE